MKLEVSQFGQKIYEVEVPREDLLGGGEIFIGRAEDCHIQLDDQQISRYHAIICMENSNPIVKKKSSFGQLTVNGSEVDKKNLDLNDRISITDFQILITDLPEKNIITKEPIKELDDFLEEDHLPVSTEIDSTELFESPSIEENTEIFEPDDAEIESTDILDELPEDSEVEEASYSDDFLSENIEPTSDSSAEESFETEENFDTQENFEADEFGGDGFGDEGFGDDPGFGDSDVGESTQVFQSFANYSLTIKGDLAPFDRYKIEENEIFIGRDPEKCQIVLNDAEVSGVHAVIKKSLIHCTIEDLKSSNGTIINGERINKAELVNGVNFSIGSTVFFVHISSDLLDSERDILMPVEQNQEIEVEEVVEEEVDFDNLEDEGGEFGLVEDQEKSIIKRILKDPKRRMIALVMIVGVLAIFMFDDSPTNSKTKTAKDPKAKTAETATAVTENKKDFSPEVLEKLEQNYALALAKYEAGEYYESKEYLEIIRGIDPEYKNTATLLKLVKQGHEELLRLKKEEEAEKERKARQLKVKNLVDKARGAVKEREVAVAESLFGQIMEIDPENIDVPQLKLELDAYKKEIEEKRLEEERKIAERKRMVDALAPGKALYLKEEWFKAIDRLEKFTKMQGMDEDLIKDATTMLKNSQRKLSAMINPLLGKARSFKEGQDLKRAYETYGDILRIDPSNEESLNERDIIFQTLTNRSRKLYREALISESLSLFEEAKEKFQQVQQVSPVNSEYYIKATSKLENYLE